MSCSANWVLPNNWQSGITIHLDSKMDEITARRSRGQVNDLGDLAKTVLCLQRIGEGDVKVVTSF